MNGGPQVVATVHNAAGLRMARTLEPGEVDFLEIRADAFVADFARLARALAALKLPLIITVRHPVEGGENALSSQRRRAMFLELLPFATLVDLELRSLQTEADISEETRAAGGKVIVSQHHFRSTPPLAALRLAVRRARGAGADICKIATLAEKPGNLSVLLALFERKNQLPVSAMGMGKFGKISRLLLAQGGSILNYGYLDRPNASGQWEARLLKKRIAEITSE